MARACSVSIYNVVLCWPLVLCSSCSLLGSLPNYTSWDVLGLEHRDMRRTKSKITTTRANDWTLSAGAFHALACLSGIPTG